ncbi:hypothetical protein BGZ76_001152 [Entomortierella beljakovae]|nr:hypothetical protein BGZ76_001152 [Entomortierella beljakovae]
MRISIITFAAILLPALIAAKTVKVSVISGKGFSPRDLQIKKGDVVEWNFVNIEHNVVQGSDCVKSENGFTSGGVSTVSTFAHTFTQTGTFPYFCDPHCSSGMKGTIEVLEN